ncbi:MAG: 50S ribosomal protein L7, partial [Oscillospiraceae bacterium]|nr:50S ribosomal protein L7 [Oscillospiraceae bacterium]
MSDILCSLGLCVRAGKLIAGFNVVCDAMKQKPKDMIVFVTKDISQKTKKEVAFYADKYCVQLVSLPITTVEINRI